jgi:hypothetical protein
MPDSHAVGVSIQPSPTFTSKDPSVCTAIRFSGIGQLQFCEGKISLNDAALGSPNSRSLAGLSLFNILSPDALPGQTASYCFDTEDIVTTTSGPKSRP